MAVLAHSRRSLLKLRLEERRCSFPREVVGLRQDAEDADCRLSFQWGPHCGIFVDKRVDALASSTYTLGAMIDMNRLVEAKIILDFVQRSYLDEDVAHGSSPPS